MRILVVEDEISLLRTIGERLTKEGYIVDTARDGEEALEFIKAAEYDLLILDIMLPYYDGLSILKFARRSDLRTPVLLLTARDSVEDRVTGLDAGADDYLVKPFSFEELLARVRALLRRPLESKDTVLTLADLMVDTVSHTVMRSGKTIPLTAKEYAVLEYLLRNKGKLVTRDQIADHVWGYDFDANSNVIDVYIRYLRRKIDDPFSLKLIHTVRGVGYILDDKQENI